MADSHTLHMGAELPALHLGWPTCGWCGEDVMIEDGVAYCAGCLLQWDHIEDGAVAHPDPDAEGSEVACEIVLGTQDPPHDDDRGNHYVPGPLKPCILPSGHGGNHLCPYDVEVTPASDTGGP